MIGNIQLFVNNFSFRSLTLLLSSIGLFGAIGGYGAWILCQPFKFEKVRKIATWLGLILIAGLFVRVSGIWREVGHAMGVYMMIMFIGFIFAISFFIVVAGYGIVQLVVHFMHAEHRFDKPAKPSSAGNLWDGELDFG